MKNVWLLFKGDLKRITQNVVTLVIAIGLVVLPSLFSWYNMLACWDVFDNTGNLKVAVANTDEGYTSDLFPTKIRIGDEVVSALRANDQLEWVITDKEDAIDGARSGRYYAAVVIPESFSRDMLSFNFDDEGHASITYYSNQKKNAIAPKLTDQGADRVAAQVNAVFTQTLAEIALNLAQSLAKFTDESGIDSSLTGLGDRIDSLGEQMEQAAGILRLYSDVLSTADGLVADSGELLSNVRDNARDAADSAARMKRTADDTISALRSTTDALSGGLERSGLNSQTMANAVNKAFDKGSASASSASKLLREQAKGIDQRISKLEAASSRLASIRSALPAEHRGALDAIVERLEGAIATEGRLRDSLIAAAKDIEAGAKDLEAQRSDTLALVTGAQTDLQGAIEDYHGKVVPMLDELGSTVKDASASLTSIAKMLDSAGEDLSASTDSISADIAEARKELEDAADSLDESAGQMRSLATRLRTALAEGDSGVIHTILGSNADAYSAVLASPVQLERHAVYPVENFGSAMSPLYTTLALWIGTLLIMVTLKVLPGRRTREELEEPRHWQLFLGRFGVVAVLSLLQSSILALGNMLFLGVQVGSPVLYLICFWVSGLVFAFITYTLVVSFANLGKALSVVLLIIQVAGGVGSFPLQMLPRFFQTISPYLPITHAVDAMRAAMFGVFNNDFWIEILTLLAFAIPFIILGFALRVPLMKVIDRFNEKVEASKLM